MTSFAIYNYSSNWKRLAYEIRLDMFFPVFSFLSIQFCIKDIQAK
jgi:hypothetical protein